MRVCSREQLGNHSALVNVAAQVVEVPQQAAAIFELVNGEAAGELQIVDLKIGLIRIAAGFKRIQELTMAKMMYKEPAIRPQL